MPKHDHAAIQQGFVATTPDDPESRYFTRNWLAVPDNIERLLETISSGQSLRRFCEKHGLTYSPVQRALTSDDLEPRYRAAQEEMAEHLLGEIERISKLVEGEILRDEHGNAVLNDDGDAIMVAGLDPKAAAVILDGLKWRITKLNQRRYSDRMINENHIIDHGKLHQQAIRELARRPRGQLIEGEVIRRELTAPVSEAPALPDAELVRARR